VNPRRLLFVLWMVLTLAWVIGSAWELWYELRAHCEQILGRNVYTAVHCLVEKADQGGVAFPRGWPIPTQITAMERILFPPISLFIVGWVAFWVASGFYRQNSN
jgi:hypothetical protein